MVDHKTAFVYSGQGAQFPGMGKDLWEEYSCVKELFEKASDICSKDMKALLFEGSAEDLKDTENTQTAVTLVDLSVRRALNKEGIESVCSAGVSLGEFSAMVDAGILSEEDVFTLVAKRGEIMASAGADVVEKYGPVGMGAVMGLDFETVASVLASHNLANVYAANNNSPVQVVISGTSAGITAAQDVLKEAGAKRVIPLKVSGPFHTPLLSGGKAALAEVLESLTFNDPVKGFYSDVTGELVATGAEAKKLSVQQMVSPVQWLVIEKNMAFSGITHVAEAGPGSVLAGLWKKSGMEQPVFPCGTLGGIINMVEKIGSESRQEN